MPRVALAMLMGAACCAAPWQSSLAAHDTPPVLTRLYSRLRPMFQRHYSEVKSHQEKASIEFAHDTRTFLIHARLKTGEWQEAHEVTGPNRRGILCSIELRQGRYDGAAVLPQTFDQRYFRTLVMAVPSPDARSFFYVHLSYPDEVSPGFLKEFQETVQQSWLDER